NLRFLTVDPAQLRRCIEGFKKCHSDSLLTASLTDSWHSTHPISPPPPCLNPSSPQAAKRLRNPGRGVCTGAEVRDARARRGMLQPLPGAVLTACHRRSRRGDDEGRWVIAHGPSSCVNRPQPCPSAVEPD